MFGIEAKLHLEIKPKAYMYTPENKEISLTPLLHATSGNLLTIDKMRVSFAEVCNLPALLWLTVCSDRSQAVTPEKETSAPLL